MLTYITDVCVVLFRLIGIIVQSGSQQRRQWVIVDKQREKLDQKMSAMLSARHDMTRRIPLKVLQDLEQVRHEQIIMRKDILDQLAQKKIDREIGTRAAGATVLFEATILLQKVRFFCSDLAVLRGEDYIDDEEAARDLQFAVGDLASVQSCYGELKQNYLVPLSGRDMRRRRAARKLFYLLTFKVSRALERDSGITDLRQAMRNLRTSVLDLQLAVKAFGSTYLTTALRHAATSYADTDDATITRRIIQIIDFPDRGKFEPQDENYPVLLLRIGAIRTRFVELPATQWSVGWIIYLAILQSWLYLFVLRHAREKKEVTLISQFLRQAMIFVGFASDQILRYEALGRGLEPLLTKFSAAGRSRQIAEFQAPPSLARLRELLDEVESETNFEVSRV